MVQTGISDTPIRVEEPRAKRQYNMDDILLAVRPELIHLMKERTGHINSFKAELLESIYLGDSVKVKIKTKDQNTMDVKLSLEAFKRYAGNDQLEFFFNADCITTIYEREKGVMLVTK